MKFFIGALLVLLLVSSVSAFPMGGAVAASGAAAARANQEAQAANVRNAQSCAPPVAFSLQHSCELRVACTTCVNTYTCGTHRVTGDCAGGVVSSYDRAQPRVLTKDTYVLAVVVGALVFLTVFAFAFFFRRDKYD